MSVADARPALRVSEAAWQRQILDLFQLHGWRCYWTWSSLHSPAGYPDLTLVHPRYGCLWIECKAQRGVVTPAQAAWHADLEAAGQRVYVLRPSDVLVAQALAAGTGTHQENSR